MDRPPRDSLVESLGGNKVGGVSKGSRLTMRTRHKQLSEFFVYLIGVCGLRSLSSISFVICILLHTILFRTPFSMLPLLQKVFQNVYNNSFDLLVCVRVLFCIWVFSTFFCDQKVDTDCYSGVHSSFTLDSVSRFVELIRDFLTGCVSV